MQVTDDNIFLETNLTADVHHPEPELLQNAQAMLDTRVPFHLQNILGSPDGSIRSSVLKICTRCLTICSRLPDEFLASDPFAALAAEFTSFPWVHGIVEALEDNKTTFTSDVFLGALRCLFAMTAHTSWTRSWATCDVLHVLVHAKKRMAGHPNTEVLRRGIDRILKMLSLTNHTYITESVASGALSGKALTYEREVMLNPISATGLLTEAIDLSFGSTLAEQAKYSDELFRWMHSVLPCHCPTRRDRPVGLVGDGTDFWKSLLELARKITGWLPAMCLSLDFDERNRERKERAFLSCDVMIKQIAVLERILLYAVANGDKTSTMLLAAVIAAQEYLALDDDADTVGCDSTNDSESGLLGILRHLDISSSSPSEGLLSARVQIQIITTINRVMGRARCADITLLCHLGVVNSCVQFMKYVVSTMRAISKKPSLVQEFLRLHPTLVGTMRGSWRALLATKSEIVLTSICDTEILKTVVCEWLSDTCNVGFQAFGTSKGAATLLVRHEALCVLRTIVVHNAVAEKVSYALSRFIATNGIVGREIDNLRSTSTRKGSSLMKASSLEVLIMLVELDSEVINASMEVMSM